ncbi:VPLPA-CTERM sorting domain-containing protein [Dinoroseobacter sp. S124A]|uniref:VPLPA-CTERM sorting domain-containing protein n=1 Tax=Dinoroseobacter sp. S124A TaxID=3415128 RepID=UPI003C79A8F2
MKKVILSGLFAILATTGHAATFSATGASASSEFSLQYVAENTIDGSGLSAPGDPGASHADYAVNNHWTTARNTVAEDASIEWSFAGPSDLGGIYIWNHRSNVISSNDGYEPVLFDLTLLNGTTVIESFDDVALSPDTDKAQAFTFDAVVSNVTSVLFEVEAVQSSNNYTGLAEVLFDDALIAGATLLSNAPSPTPVPLPAGGLLLLSGVAGIAAMRRKRR